MRYRMTPQMALFILVNLNALNPRKMDKNEAKKRYADAIRNGEWQPITGNPIKFLINGMLADGQHRLEAIVDAQQTVYVEVMLGLTHEAASFIDGGKPRSVAVSWAMAEGKGKESVSGYNKPTQISRIWRLREVNWKASRFTRPSTLAFYKAHKAQVDLASGRILFQPADGAGFRGAIARYSSFNFRKAQTLFEQVTGDGANLSKNSPALMLRNYFQKARCSKEHPEDRRKDDFRMTERACYLVERNIKNGTLDFELP